MSQAPSVAFAGTTEDSHVEAPANVSLRGTTRGLEVLITGTPTAAALGARLTELLAEAPSFFAGSNARVAIDGMLPVGALACLEQVAAQFELRLVEIGPAAARRPRGELAAMAVPLAAVLPPIPPIPAIPSIPSMPAVATLLAPTGASVPRAEAPGPGLAEGTGPIADDGATAAPGDPAGQGASTPTVPGGAAATGGSAADPGLVAALAAVLVAAGGRDSATDGATDAATDAAGPRLVIGPVRSGRIVDHVGHLIVIGDVNPGAEVRAEGSIIVLGRLRGVAHAAIGRDAGCIIALSLQPQQLRIGRMVARAGDADRPGGGAEIAYATGETIVVERFSGRLPSGLAASM
jgi:septum formation inhibitor MinC